ncbi:hypothetical protein [Siccibacter turicensis]|uniref:hypothetical protein n=1 Tax=Siccibacter turicensis TaxID=357233 RepID=UPI002A6A617D|nr:hypothetical protein [Siccibacter turicensis]MDY0970738.1 hypothetical protein [Siccibacter turicensis]
MSIKTAVAAGVLLLGYIMTSYTYASDNKIKIRSLFNINKAFCAIKTNDVLGMDNRYSALEGVGMGTSSTNAMLALENGINDITIEIGALGWFSDEHSKHQVRDEFSPDSYCNVALTIFSGEERKTVAQIKIAVNDKGVPQAIGYDEGKQKIESKKIVAWQVEEGHLDDKYFIKNYFPKDMTIYQFTQKVSLKGIPEWRWVKATPFTGKPEQVQALKNAYAELWRLFSAKDNRAIKNNMKELLNAWAIATDSDVDELYNSHQFVTNFKDKSFRMIPINWDDYKVEVMNKGRLVRFVNKSDPTVYPLSYYVKNEDGGNDMQWFTPIFSLVDGKFIPVI